MARSTKPRRADFYPDDWLAGTLELTLEEEGAYIRICALIYSKGQAIPGNDRWLAGMCRVSTRKWRSLRDSLITKGKITIEDGLIRQKRCEFELGKAAERSQKQAENVAKRWRNRAESELNQRFKNDEADGNSLENKQTGDTTDYTRARGLTNHQPPTLKESNTVASLTARQFDEFWSIYPSRRSHSNPKKPARAKFEAALKRGAVAADIIRGAENYAAYVEREGTDPKYVAQAQTWINQERWTQYQEAVVTEPTPLML